MANVSYSSELMTQLVPESAIPKSNRFYIVQDGEHHPMIFSLGDQGTLYLVKIDPKTGKNMLVDLSAKFGLSRKVVAFNVTQDQDMTIYLVFAEEGEVGKGSNVHVMKPVKPSDSVWSRSVDPKSYLFERNVAREIVVTRIFLGTGDDGNGYPVLVLIYSNVDGTLPQNAEVARITVNSVAGTWDYLPNFRLPENARAMDDICVANVRGVRGLFTLYRIQDTQTLAFVGFPSKYGVSTTVDLVVPEGARSLATFSNDDGFTDLVIGATKGLYYLTDQACSSSEACVRPTLISREGDDFLKGSSQLYIAQTKQQVSIWARNQTDDVVYQQFAGLSFSTQTALTDRAVPLLTKKEGGGVFAAVLDPNTHLQTFFILGVSGQLHMLTQKAELGAWDPARTIDVPSTENYSEFTSYTTHVTLVDENGTNLVNKTLLLLTATLQDVSVNGIVLAIGPEGQNVTTDSQGSLTLISRSPNLDAVVLTLRDVKESTLLGREYAIDPAQKVKNTLSKISSPKALENVRLKDGTRLLDSSTVKPEAAQKVSLAFGMLGRRLNSIDTGEKCDIEAQANDDGEDGESMLWGAWHWVSQKFDEFTDAVVRFAKGAWRFIVDIAGKLYSFVVETASQVLKSMHWLLEDVLGIPISKIISYLGFLFDWDDILFTRTVIVDTVNFGLDWAAEGVDLLADLVDDFFEDVKKKVENLTVPDEIKKQRQSAQETQAAAKKHGKQNEEMKDHPGGNWSNYQMEHGGVKQAKAIDKGGAVQDLDLFEGVIKPAVKAFTETLGKVSDGLKQLADPKSNLSIGDILLLIGGDIANAFIEGTRIIACGLIKVLGAVIRTLKDVFSYKIEIPLLSSLYRKISGGNDLTILDAMALLLAVPTTVLFKIMHNKSPSAMTDPEPHPLSEFYGKTPPAWSASAPSFSNAFVANEKEHLSGQISASSTFAMGQMNVGFLAINAQVPPGYYSDGKHDPPWVKWWNRFMWFWKRKSEIFPILALIGNLWSTYASFGAVMAPDVPTHPWLAKFYLAKDVILFFATIPVHPWSPKRPGPGWRLLSWGSGIIPVILKEKYNLPKKEWAVYSFYVGCFQALLDVIVVIEEWEATKEEYPERPDTVLMSLHTANVVFASAAKVVLPVAIFLQGGNIYFNVIGWGASGLASISSLVVYGVECAEGIHHPVVSLLGTS